MDNKKLLDLVRISIRNKNFKQPMDLVALEEAEKHFANEVQNDKRKLGQRSKLEEGYSSISIIDLLNKDFGEYGWIIDNLIPEDGLTLITGKPKTGKTWFLQYLIKNIGLGSDVFNFKVKKKKILLVDEENSIRGLYRRYKKLGIHGLNKETIKLEILSKQNIKIDLKEDRDYLIKYATDNNIQLIVFDSYRRISSLDENDSLSNNKIYGFLKEIQIATNSAIIMIHHDKKGQNWTNKGLHIADIDTVRGSGDITGMADSILQLQSVPLEDRDGNRTLVSPTLRESAKTKPFIVEWFDSEDVDAIIFEYKGEFDNKSQAIKEAKEFILSAIDDSKEYSIKQFDKVRKERNLSFGVNTIRTACSELVNEECLIARTGEGRQHNTKFYKLKIT